MLAVQIMRFGGPEVLEVVNIPEPSIGANEVLVKMAYAGVNFSDIYRRRGMYLDSPTYPMALPWVLGLEGSGIIVSSGSDVIGFATGDRVAFGLTPGAYAEYVRVPVHRLVRIPTSISLDLASAIITHGMTAHYLANEFALKHGDSCLIHAAAGGVGQMLVQLAKLAGARVIATVGSEEKASIARECGADEVILYRETDFQKAVRDLTQQHGVDIVFDSVGKDTLHGSLNSLRRRGICVLFGHTSGLVDKFNTMELAEAGSVFLTRPHLQHYISTNEEYAKRANDIMNWVAEGTLRATIQKLYPLQHVGEAHRTMEERRTLGKLLLRMSH